jgi:tRNA pseudouridine13 synthase
MTQPKGEVAEREARLLEAEGLTLDAFERGKGETQGGRRPYRIALGNAELAVLSGADYRVAFELPPGSYATVVLDELIKGNTG